MCGGEGESVTPARLRIKGSGLPPESQTSINDQLQLRSLRTRDSASPGQNYAAGDADLNWGSLYIASQG